MAEKPITGEIKMKLEEFLALDIKKKFEQIRKESPSRDPEELRQSETACFMIQRVYHYQNNRQGPKQIKDYKYLPLDLSNKPCVQCSGKELYHGETDVGTFDYIDNFWDICLDCLYATHREEITHHE